MKPRAGTRAHFSVLTGSYPFFFNKKETMGERDWGFVGTREVGMYGS